MNRIKQLRHQRQLSMQQLAEASGTSKSQIDKLERGERRLTVDWMVRLAKPLGVDPRELMSPMLVTTPANDGDDGIATGETFSQDSASLIPVRAAARGGNDQEMFLRDGPIDHVPRPYYLLHARDAYAIYVVGSSMAPMYRPGQLLFVNPYKPPVAGSGAVIVKHNSAVLIKEFVRENAYGIVVREYAPRMREFSIPREDIVTMHTVVGAAEP